MEERKMLDLKHLFSKYSIVPTGILHCGANVGQEAELYFELGVANVCWIEANPRLCVELKSHVSEYGHFVYHFAASDEEGTVVLHEASNGGLSSSVLELGSHSVHHPTVSYIRDIEVPARRIMDVADFDDLDFLVIDVQGAELKVLRGTDLTQFKWILLEVNKEEVYKGCALIDEIDAYLKDYTRVETVWNGNDAWGESFYKRNDA